MTYRTAHCQAAATQARHDRGKDMLPPCSSRAGLCEPMRGWLTRPQQTAPAAAEGQKLQGAPQDRRCRADIHLMQHTLLLVLPGAKAAVHCCCCCTRAGRRRLRHCRCTPWGLGRAAGVAAATRCKRGLPHRHGLCHSHRNGGWPQDACGNVLRARRGAAGAAGGAAGVGVVVAVAAACGGGAVQMVQDQAKIRHEAAHPAAQRSAKKTPRRPTGRHVQCWC